MSRNLEREIAPRLQAIDALLPSFEDVAKRRAARATPVTTTSTTATTALTTTTATTTGPSLTTAGPQSANAGGDGIDLLDIALALLDRLIDKEGVVPRNEFRQWAAMKDEFVALRDGEIRRRTTEKTTGSGPVPAGQPSKIDKLDALIAQQQALVNKYATTVMRYETQQTGEMLGAPVTLRERDRHDSLMVKARDERDRLLALKALEEEAINSAANASNTTTTTTVTTPRHN